MAERLDPATRRRQIVETALDIIDERGVQGLSMRELSRACSLSAPGLMHHFPDMPTLLTAVVRFRDERDQPVLAGGILEPGAARALLDRTVENIAHRPKAAELFAIVEAQAIDPRHPGHDYFNSRFEEIVAEIEPLIALEYEDAAGLARQLFSVMDGLQLNWLRNPSAFRLEEHWACIADAIFANAQPAQRPWAEAVEEIREAAEAAGYEVPQPSRTGELAG